MPLPDENALFFGDTGGERMNFGTGFRGIFIAYCFTEAVIILEGVCSEQ